MYVSVTAGNAPYIAFTVAMEFVPSHQYVEKENEDAWYYEMFEFPAPIPANEATEPQILQQIVPSGARYSLPTLDRQDFKFSFCPDGGTTLR